MKTTTDTQQPEARAVAGTAHTPTPWHTGCGLHRAALSVDWACYIDNGKRQVAAIVQSGARTRLEAEANAAFIVRACNSHEALVEALERVAQLLQYGEGDGETQPDGEEAMLVLNWHIAHARKTLASLR